MKPQTQYPPSIPDAADTRLVWLVALVAGGLAIIAAALAFDLHNQKRRIENVGAQLKQTETLRESEGKALEERKTTAESALKRLNDVDTDIEADLKKLNEAYTQRTPLVKQSAEVQGKLQALVNDLLELAKTDPDARTITRKYNIQAATPSPGAGGAKP